MNKLLASLICLTLASSCSDRNEINSAAASPEKSETNEASDPSGSSDATIEKNSKTGVGSKDDEILNGTKIDPASATPTPTPAATPTPSPSPTSTPVPNRCTRFKNPNNNFDVSGDGFVSPIDSLILVSYINNNGPQVIPPAATGTIPNAPNAAPNAVLAGPLYLAPSTSVAYMDVNGDCKIDTLDSEAVIAKINEGTP